MIVQKLKSSVKKPYDMAEKYYAILIALNNIALTQRELQLLSYTAVEGNISDPTVKQRFCDEFKTTVPTVYNAVGRLKKLNLLVKEGKEIKVNPYISLNFKDDVLLTIKMIHG